MPTIDLGILSPGTTISWTEMPQEKQPPEEENMYEREYEQQKYLKSRLANVIDEKKDQLAEQFLVEWTDFPKTPAEVKQRMADGKYTWDFGNLKDDATIPCFETGLNYFFSWRTQPADNKGYEAAIKQLHKDATAVKDHAMFSYEAGIKALQDLEAKTYH